jgi:hypothetical protein
MPGEKVRVATAGILVPRSPWKIRPGAAKRLYHAMSSARQASSVVIALPIDQPTMRLYRSSTTARHLDDLSEVVLMRQGRRHEKAHLDITCVRYILSASLLPFGIVSRLERMYV